MPLTGFPHSESLRVCLCWPNKTCCTSPLFPFCTREQTFSFCLNFFYAATLWLTASPPAEKRRKRKEEQIRICTSLPPAKWSLWSWQGKLYIPSWFLSWKFSVIYGSHPVGPICISVNEKEVERPLLPRCEGWIPSVPLGLPSPILASRIELRCQR